MTVEVFYDQTRPSAPWCVQTPDREDHFESRWRAEEAARAQGWKSPLRESLAEWLDTLHDIEPDLAAEILLNHFDIKEKETQ